MIKFRNFKFINLFCILAVFLVFIGFHFLQAQGKPDKDKPPGKPKPPPPELSLDYGDIVTTESNALRVWQYGNPDPRWSTDTPGYSSVAVGDVDNDGNKEIVVPVIQEVKGKRKSGKKYKIFLNVYKEGVSGIWQTTEEYPVIEDEKYPLVTEVMIADVDSEPDGDEIILLTDHNLAVFKYDESNFVIKASTTSAVLTGTSESNFVAVTAGDVPGDGNTENRIVVSIYDSYDHKGYVCTLNEDLSCDDNNKIPVEIEGDPQIFFRHRSLRLAKLDDDDDLEICTVGYNSPGENGDNLVLWKAYVIVWDWNDEWEQTQLLLPGWEGEPENSWPRAYLDTGDLIDEGYPGEEIVVSANLPGYSDAYQLIIYSYSGSGITNIPQNGYKEIQARIYDVEVGDVYGNGANEIVVAGRARGGANLVFYLEVFGSDLITLWQRIGGGKEGWVIDAAIVK